MKHTFGEATLGICKDLGGSLLNLANDGHDVIGIGENLLGQSLNLFML
jgi:hypothetical protein